MAAAGFQSRSLSSRFPYVWRHISLLKMCWVRHIKLNICFLPQTLWHLAYVCLSRLYKVKTKQQTKITNKYTKKQTKTNKQTNNSKQISSSQRQLQEFFFIRLRLSSSTCISVVRAFAHGAMGRRIVPSWRTHWAISRSIQFSTTDVRKDVVCLILYVGWSL